MFYSLSLLVNLVSESLEHAKTNSLISLGYGDADEGIFPIFVSTSPSAIIQGPELSSLQRDYSPNNFTISNSFLTAENRVTKCYGVIK